MKKYFFILFALVLCLPQTFRAQIPTNTLVQIVKAEDERRYDATLENLLKNPDAKIRQRAALAAGRIGDERAIPALVAHLNDDPATTTMVLFALGEIESSNVSPQVAEILKDTVQSGVIRARAIEAAGKIAAANPKDAKTPELGKAIISVLENEFGKGLTRNRETVLLGITAILRARSEGGEAITAKFLDDSDARIRADALNTLARLRSKKVNEKARELLARDIDPIVRANAARMLGVGEDKSAIDLLLNAATKDVDSRVRVSAIRSLGNLKDASVAEKLLEYNRFQFAKFVASVSVCNSFKAEREIFKEKTKDLCAPENKSEFLEIAVILGRLLPNSNNQKAVEFLQAFRLADRYKSPEIEIAFALIAPKIYVTNNSLDQDNSNWQPIANIAQGFAETSDINDKSFNEQREKVLGQLSGVFEVYPQLTLIEADFASAAPEIMRAYARFKTSDLATFLISRLKDKDVISRATAAELLSSLPSGKESIEALKSAFNQALLADKQENDAQLAILNALYKLDKKSAVGTFLVALGAPDYLVRKRAAEILKDQELQKDFPGIQSSLESFKAKKGNQVLPYAAYTGTKLGQILNTNADYIRAVSRKNGTVKAVFTTTKGNFTIDFTPEDAPLAVDNFIKLARTNYFNGVSVHRVVPNFVMQDGDPRGDGNGGPGWQIRCEINDLPYERGAVGMALSGKDTGGSQWFVTHSPQPHLDGGYTVFGKVNENDMKVVDNIVRGDKILKVVIIETRKLNKK